MNKPARSGSGSSITLSVLLHLILAAGIFAAWWWNRKPEPAGDRLALTATVVDSGTVKTPPPPDPAPPQADPVPEPETPPQEDSNEKLRQQQEALAQAAEEQRVADERRVAAEREEAERHARDKAEKDKAEREKVERERLAREKLEREKAERERRAKAEIDKARATREAELNAQLAAEERLAAARASGQMAQYISQITRKIESNWNRPPSAVAGLQCEVSVTQLQGGVVAQVKVGRCNGDQAVKQSIEDAVYRASPLPQPADSALFERNLVVTFRPEH
jgi:colicin import membrane protein